MIILSTNKKIPSHNKYDWGRIIVVPPLFLVLDVLKKVLFPKGIARHLSTNSADTLYPAPVTRGRVLEYLINLSSLHLTNPFP